MKTYDTTSAKFAASLSVAGLIIFSMFADWKSKDKAAMVAQKSARKEARLSHHSEWGLGTMITMQNDSEFFTWTETLSVPMGTVPVGPSVVPRGKEPMKTAVERLVAKLAGNPTQFESSPELRTVSIKKSATSMQRWCSSDEFDGSFCVVSAAARSAQKALTQPIGWHTTEPLPEVLIEPELQEKIDAQTDFIFADFLLTRETADEVKSTYRFRLWFDYASGEWREFDVKLDSPNNSLAGKWDLSRLVGQL